MIYSTKELCRFCNVGRETLRHYEKLGFLHPKINPANRYRSYDEKDAGTIVEIKRYQSIGLSLKEIRILLSENDLPQLSSSLRKRIDFCREQAEYYQILCRKNEFELHVINRIPDLIGNVRESHIPDLVFFTDHTSVYAPDARSSRLFPEKNPYELMGRLDILGPCCRITWRFEEDGSPDSTLEWGLLAVKELADRAGLIDGFLLPRSGTVSTVVYAKEDEEINPSLFCSFASYIRERFSDPAPVFYAYLLARTHEADGKNHGYLYTIYPMEAGTPVLSRSS